MSELNEQDDFMGHKWLHIWKSHTDLIISTKSAQLISKKMTFFDECLFGYEQNAPGGKAKLKKYSINTFTSCIEDDNSTFQREELIFVHLIIHHAGPLWMYTLYTQRRIWLRAGERDWELEKETQRQGPISQSCVCHDFTNTSAITLN